MVTAEQWASTHPDMAAPSFIRTQGCNAVITSLLLHLMGPESSGWRFTWGALKPGRALLLLSLHPKMPAHVSILSETLFPAHHPFCCWHHEPGAQAKDSPGAKDTAAVPGHGTAACWQPGLGSDSAYVPFRDAFAVLGCCPARGCHSSCIQG